MLPDTKIVLPLLKRTEGIELYYALWLIKGRRRPRLLMRNDLQPVEAGCILRFYEKEIHYQIICGGSFVVRTIPDKKNFPTKK
jgi:hypothetical protein